jgi:hypothetical protein
MVRQSYAAQKCGQQSKDNQLTHSRVHVALPDIRADECTSDTQAVPVKTLACSRSGRTASPRPRARLMVTRKRGGRLPRWCATMGMNWRITFGWVSEDAVDVDLEDYH